MTSAMTDQTVLDAIVWAGSQLGYELRARQKEVVLNFVKGRDVFVSLPTGSGKSLCYSVLPWTYDCLRCRSKPSSIIIVVSPLVALMKDQVSSLAEKGMSAVYVGEASNSEDKIAQIYEGQFQVVFFSPELLLTDETWRDMLQSPLYKENLVGFIVDEAHCVKKW